MSANDDYINAILADAAYVNGLFDGMSGGILQSALTIRMTPTQADFISTNFKVRAAINTNDAISTGFDATVWEGLENTPYAGQVYVSMRGTEFGGTDLATDIDIALGSGTALGQYESMVNWWLQISTPLGIDAKQVAFVEGQGFVAAPSVAGTGKVVGVSNVFVNGHSLGGNLATGFARLFGGSLTINHITTFNSPGFLSGSEAVFQRLGALLGTGPGRYPTPAEQTNIFSTNGMSLTTNSWWSWDALPWATLARDAANDEGQFGGARTWAA